MVDLEALASQVGPLVSATVAAYGTAALTKAEDAAATETVRLGQRLLGRLLKRTKSAPGITGAVTDLANALEDEDFHAALRAQIKKALREDPQLATDLTGLLPDDARHAVTASEGSIAIGGDSSGINSVGDGAINIQRR
jgi:dienelactone hydrolase